MFGNLNGGWLFAAWLAILVLVFVPPTNPPGASPALAQGASAGGEPVELSSHYDGEAPPYPDDDPPSLTYSERFGHDAIGSDWAWAEAACMGTIPGHCPISRAAVTAQGVGE